MHHFKEIPFSLQSPFFLLYRNAPIFHKEKYPNFLIREFASLLDLKKESEKKKKEQAELAESLENIEQCESVDSGEPFDSMDLSSFLKEENFDEEDHEQGNPDDEYIDKENEK